MYKVIEKNEYGVLVRENKPIISCDHCKYGKIDCKNIDCKGTSTYYLTDQEAAKLETESYSQKELIDLQLENDQLKERIKDLESEKSTELIDSPYSSVICQYMLTKCCNIHVDKDHNFCPNCGRKIVR